MGDFAQGFVRGFAGTLQKGIETRREDARNYFTRQLEIAQTTGVENRNRVRQSVDASTRIAKQLQQTGVPKDIIMSIASSNPEELSSFSEQVARAQAAGIEVNEEFFRDFVEVSKDFKAPDEDFGTFFARVYEPIAANASADPAAFNDDRKGSIWASMLGLNATEKAQQRLAETPVVDGMSAADLLAYKDTPTPNTQGSPTVTYNYDLLADMEKQARGEEGLSISERNSINTRIEDLSGTLRSAVQEELQLDTANPEAKAILDAEVNRRVHEALLREYDGVPGVESFLTTRLGVVPEEPPAEPVESPVEGQEEVLAPTPAQEPSAPVEGPVEPLGMEEITAAEAVLGVTDVINNPDGTVTMTLPNGETKTYRSSDFREFLKSKQG